MSTKAKVWIGVLAGVVVYVAVGLAVGYYFSSDGVSMPYLRGMFWPFSLLRHWRGRI